MNIANPSIASVKSTMSYREGYCDLKKFKVLSLLLSAEPMGQGATTPQKLPEQYAEWMYPPPNSAAALIMDSVCIVAELL